MTKLAFLEAMNFDELWVLHERLTKILSDKIASEKLELDKRLAQLNGADLGESQETQPRRRKYPKVLPKYYNPSAPNEKWSGRGKMPRWLVAALQAGRKLEDFRIDTAEKSDS
ncbi:H-NS family nucleoid-associated regulatory protein [Bradyrhizobium symbiodeficiens]|uniref:H-NS histone family protein n=1 Tax=Bradyrhizobium symbiodeficiens TaxID=1404367 RepID=UPI00140FB8AE|nr:H-NS histone family protein [Bradyrhizobium symbiodeficiens]QIO98904.1 H-NS histone family protein [Bradyrhizobium symbiodeficiens]